MIIGVSGKAQAGKDTFGKLLKESAAIYNVEVQRRAFADKLKEYAQEHFQLTDAQVYGSEKETMDPRWETTPRQIMQKLGAGYRAIHPDYWVRAVLGEYEEIVERPGGTFTIGVEPLWVVTDMRYKNEYDAIKAIPGSKLVRIERSNKLRGFVHDSGHASEIDLDDVQFPHVVYNNGTVSQLSKWVRRFFITEVLPNLKAGTCVNVAENKTSPLTYDGPLRV